MPTLASEVAFVCTEGVQMPEFIVNGDANVEVEGKTYAPGKTFTATQKDVQWLIDSGYIKKKGSKK